MTRKVWTRIAATLGVLSLALTGCASGNSAKSGADSNEIRVGLESTFAPYGYHDESGKLVGFEKEIADALAADLGKTPVYVESPWESLIAGLDNKNYDLVINNLAPTEERKAKYDFTDPYYVSESWAIVREDSGLESEKDLAGKSCAQTASSNYAQDVRNLGGEITPTNGFADSVQLVEQGRADCTVNGDITLSYYLEQHPDAPLKIFKIESAPGVPTAVMINKGNPELLDSLNKSLAELKSSGKLDSIVAKYTPQA